MQEFIDGATAVAAVLAAAAVRRPCRRSRGIGGPGVLTAVN